MDESPQRVVARGYDAIGSRYRDWSGGSPVRRANVDDLLRRLPTGSTVVDLGCGPGEPATRLLARGHRVVGVDLSPVQLSLARRAAPSATFVRADMARIALRTGSVDAVASFYALGHLPPTAHAPLLRSIARWLRPRGVVLISAPLVAGDAEVRRVLRPGGRLVVSTNDETGDGLWQLFLDAGLGRPPVSARWPLSGARDALRAAGFRDIRDRVFDYVLDIPSPEPVLDYLDSCRSGFPDLTEHAWERIRGGVAARVAAHISRHGSLRRAGRVGLVIASTSRAATSSATPAPTPS